MYVSDELMGKLLKDTNIATKDVTDDEIHDRSVRFVKSHTTEVACFHTCFSGGMDSLTEDTVITPQLHAV